MVIDNVYIQVGHCLNKKFGQEQYVAVYNPLQEPYLREPAAAPAAEPTATPTVAQVTAPARAPAAAQTVRSAAAAAAAPTAPIPRTAENRVEVNTGVVLVRIRPPPPPPLPPSPLSPPGAAMPRNMLPPPPAPPIAESTIPRSARQPSTLKRGDTRFHPCVRKRNISCDDCGHWYKYKLGFDGTYVHKLDFPWSLQTSVEKMAFAQQEYENGRWNATWRCAWCWMNSCNHRHGTTYDLASTREWLGISETSEKELARKQARTQQW